MATQTAASPERVLLEQLAEARRQSDDLFAIVRPEALYDRPIAERHRIIFYIGHLEAFDWNLLRERLLARESFDPELDRLFAFGIDPVGGGLPTDQASDWPPVKVVRGYVQQVRDALDQALVRQDFRADAQFSSTQLLNVAVEHRLMHAETLAYMLHQLPHNRKVAGAPSAIAPVGAVDYGMVQIPAGVATLGQARQDGGFGWDNEFEENTVEVPAFAIDRFKITNEQFLEFVAAGGYENRDLWSDEAWEWKEADRISHPVFWRRTGDRWQYRTMFANLPLPLTWPVYVSHAEAAAYAKWAGKALPSEAQWHRAAYATAEGRESSYPWGEAAPSARHGNFDFQRWDPVPVNAHADGNSAFGISGLLGNGWEWTSSLFAPFPGFEPFPFYPGYSANFFDGKHYVIKGGSARTAACMLRRPFRNWFQPHYQYVYAGFRCVNKS
jgi:gamma-glutamyl hercynylcysteine S-oxide synthase